MSLESFQARLGIPLVKSVHPDDFAAIRKETDPSAVDVVDHTPDLKAHPSSMSAKVEEYRRAIASGSPMMRTSPNNLHGVSAKATYKVHSAANLPVGKDVLVKPYHEKLHDKCKFWQRHPIQGWAEMTNQSLWHAAGLGPMHQEVHVSEHDMGPGFEKHPALVIHMDPTSDYVENIEPWMYNEKMGRDAIKIGVMDFLSNNLDRHRRNLLVRPDTATDSYGLPVASHLIGIDHTRSFQYHAAHKGIPTHIEDPLFGRVAVPEEVREAKNTEAKIRDNLLPYLRSDAMVFLNSASKDSDAAPLFHPSNFLRTIADWWPDVRNKVIMAFGDRLAGIKEEKMRNHLLTNFRLRVEKLDDIASRPEWYAKNRNVDDLGVSLVPWDR